MHEIKGHQNTDDQVHYPGMVQDAWFAMLIYQSAVDPTRLYWIDINPVSICFLLSGNVAHISQSYRCDISSVAIMAESPSVAIS